MSRSMSTSPAASQPGLIDPLVESLIDYSEYDNNMQYQSPSLSPSMTSKSAMVRPSIKTEATTAASLMPTPQPMSGPSHQYDLYKQQTGIVPGALASTLAVNENNSEISGYNNFTIDYLGLGNAEDVFDFNAAPSQGTLNTSEMDMDFDSPAGEASFFFPTESTVNPSSIGGQEPASSLPSPPVLQTQSVGRVWPGMHQQAALAKARAQREQQEQIIQQQQRRSVGQGQTPQPRQAQRPKGVQPTDPIVEQKITQLLNSMRAKPTSDSDNGGSPMPLTRLKKDEEDMDDDERLLASEEGKKLSSKERRQLRNKVSARAFRSRRKEYITQLESEIANKVNENGDLRAHNRALVEENKRLTDLTRMLLSSPSFSDFLDRLSSNPQPATQTQQQPQQQQQETSRQAPKDVSSYAAQQHLSQQQINLAIIPEHNMDFSMLSLDTTADAFNYQPQVYAVFETPEPPVIDTAVLAGKTSNFVGPQLDSDEEKVEMPVIEERPVAPVSEVKTEVVAAPTVVDEEFENDERFSLYHSEPVAPKTAEAVVELDTTNLTQQEMFGGIQTEKALARYDLVDVSEENEAEAALAMARVQRLSASLESVMARLELLTCDL